MQIFIDFLSRVPHQTLMSSREVQRMVCSRHARKAPNKPCSAWQSPHKAHGDAENRTHTPLKPPAPPSPLLCRAFPEQYTCLLRHACCEDRNQTDRCNRRLTGLRLSDATDRLCKYRRSWKRYSRASPAATTDYGSRRRTILPHRSPIDTKTANLKVLFFGEKSRGIR